MGLSALSGPLVIHGPSPSNSAANQSVLPITPDAGPTSVFGGVALFDPRFSYKGGAGTENNALFAISAALNGGYLSIDQAPSTVTTQNIAAAAATTTGTNLTLVSSSGAGITVLASALTIPQTGNIVPSGALAIDTAPALVYFGNNKSTAIADPTKAVARAIAISATSGAAGGNFLISGYDLYGYPQTQLLTVLSSPTGTTSTTTTKAFKFISSIKANVTDTKSYSVGTADVYGFPLRSDKLAYTTITWAGTPIVSSAGFVAAVTSVATNTTGDVRGTYATQSASDGTKSLQIFQDLSPANISTIAGIFGVTPA